jgi:hypothetical protein
MPYTRGGALPESRSTPGCHISPIQGVQLEPRASAGNSVWRSRLPYASAPGASVVLSGQAFLSDVTRHFVSGYYPLSLCDEGGASDGASDLRSWVGERVILPHPGLLPREKEMVVRGLSWRTANVIVCQNRDLIWATNMSLLRSFSFAALPKFRTSVVDLPASLTRAPGASVVLSGQTFLSDVTRHFVSGYYPLSLCDKGGASHGPVF